MSPPLHGWHHIRSRYAYRHTHVERGWEPLVILAVALAVMFALC